MAGNNAQEQFYGAELTELSNNIKNLNAKVESMKSVCAERYRMDFCSEINVLKYSVDALKDDYDKLEAEIKSNYNAIAECNNQCVELSGQLNSVKLKIEELLTAQNKQTESKMDLWKQIIIIVLGTLIVSLTLWITNHAINSFKQSIYNDIREEQVIDKKMYEQAKPIISSNTNHYKNN